MQCDHSNHIIEQQELPFTVGGNIKCYIYFVKQFGNFLENYTYF